MRPHALDPKLKGALLVLLAGICWGMHGVLLKLAFSFGASFMDVFLLEAGLAAIIFYGLLRRQGSFQRPSRPAQWAFLGLAGLASMGVGTFLFLSFSLGPVAIGATLLFLYLPQVYIVSALLSKERWNARGLASIALLLIGAAVATDFLNTLGEPGSRGALLAGAIASSCYAAIFLLTPRISKSSSATFRSLFICLVNLIGSALVLLLLPSTRGQVTHGLLIFCALAVALGVVGQALPTLALMKGIPLAGPSLSGVLASTELPIAVISSAIILSEPLTLQKIAGVACVVSGVVLFNLRRR